MDKKHILVGIDKELDSFQVVEIIGKLIKEYEVHVLENGSDLEKTFFLFEELLDDGEDCDLFIILCNDKKNYDEFENTEFNKYIDLKSPNHLVYDVNADFKLLIEEIEIFFGNMLLVDYTFVLTSGSLTEELETNHYIAMYEKKDLLENLAKSIKLRGGKVIMITFKEDHIYYCDEIFHVKNIDEFTYIFESKKIKGDFIFNGAQIPRIGLVPGEKIKVEYAKYFAELQEKYIPLNDVDSKLRNQVYIQVLTGIGVDVDSISYYFANTGIDLIAYFDRGTKNIIKYFYAKEPMKVVQYSLGKSVLNSIIDESMLILERGWRDE